MFVFIECVPFWAAEYWPQLSVASTPTDLSVEWFI